MQAYPLFWYVTSADYYSSAKYKQPKLHVKQSCLFTTSKFADTN